MGVDVLGLVASPYGDGHFSRFSPVVKNLELLGYRTAVAVVGDRPFQRRYFSGSEVRRINLPYDIGNECDADSVIADVKPSPDYGRLSIAQRDHFSPILREFRPRVVLMEGYPFMREAWSPIGDVLVNYKQKQENIVIAGCVRDIIGHQEMVRMGIVSREDPRLSQIDDLLERHIDGLIVQGDSSIAVLDREIDDAFSEKVFYTGYVADQMPARSSMREEDRHVLFSVGAGSHGGEILLRALEARRRCSTLAGRPWHLITGHKADDGLLVDLADKAAALGFDVQCEALNIISRHPAIIISKHCDDFRQRLVDSFLAVIGGGYNTVVEALAGGARVLAVPTFRMSDGEIARHPEQTSRLRIMRQAGFLQTLGPRKLNDPLALAQAMEEMALREVPSVPAIRTDGARTAAALIGQWAGDGFVSPLRTRHASFQPAVA